MINITKSPRVLLSLYLMTAGGSYFMPVVASSDVTPFETTEDLKTALGQYCAGNFNSTSSEYGEIEEWDVSKITSLFHLFLDANGAESDCNPDISKWDTSSVTNFRGTFYRTPFFNQPLSSWNVSSGNSFTGMFHGAVKFNQNISNWDVSSGIEFNKMFYTATSFNQPLSSWNISSATNFDEMFYGATSFNQSHLYCNWQSNPFLDLGTGVCGQTVDCGWGDETCPPTNVPTPSPITASTPSSGNGGGDPHFKTFNGKAFSYHGECDLVLMRSKSFEDGKGLSIHVRTTRMDNYRGAAYSYISAAAVQMGNTVLEVSADDGSLLVDGSSQVFTNDAAEGSGADILSLAAGYTLKRSTKGKHGLITVFDLNLGDEKKISIRCNTKSMMLFVDVTGYFEDSEGLLGAPVGGSEGLGSRPNAAGHRFDMTGNWNSYGEEWQVLDTEPSLFQEKRFPQYPQGCVYESSTSFKKKKTMLRRRLLLDSVDEAALEMDARKACAKSVGGDDTIMNQFCFDDVMATGDLELAEDPFYQHTASSTAE